MKRARSRRGALGRRRTRGAALLEQVVLLGVAVLGLVGFSRFGTELHEQLDQEAEHIRGRGTPGSALSLDALAGNYQPLPVAGMPLPALPGSSVAARSPAPLGTAARDTAARDTAARDTAASTARPPSGGTGSGAASAAPVRPAPVASAGTPGNGSSSSSSSSTPKNRDLVCGESGRYKSDLGAGSRAQRAPRVPDDSNLQRDHIPQSKSLQTRADQLLDDEIEERVRKAMSARCRHLTSAEEKSIVEAVRAETAAAIQSNLHDMVENNGFTIALPAPVHINGRTYGNSSLAPTDAADLGAAARADIDHYLAILNAEVRAGNITAECADTVRAVLAGRRGITTEQYETELMKSVLRQLRTKAAVLKGALEQRFQEEEKCQ